MSDISVSIQPISIVVRFPVSLPGVVIYGPYFDVDAAIADGLTTGQSFSLTYPNGYDLPEGMVIKIP